LAPPDQPVAITFIHQPLGEFIWLVDIAGHIVTDGANRPPCLQNIKW